MPTKKSSIAKAVVAKKAATKKVTAVSKKTVVKSTKKVSSEKALVYAENETSFWLADGQILNSLVALKDALESLEEAVYSHHVTLDKNDFAEWVGHILDDKDCATALKKAKTPAAAKAAVVKHLKAYSH